MIDINDIRDITKVAKNHFNDVQPWVDVDHVSLAIAEICELVIKAAWDGLSQISYEVNNWSNLCFYKVRDFLESEGFKLSFDTSENHCWLIIVDWSC